jgi:hypothetical protein
MSPADYLTAIAIPTVDEYLSATGDVRRAVLACLTAYHLRDYVASACGGSKAAIDRKIQALCPVCWDVVEGVGLGSKHVRNTSTGNFKFTLGDERPIPAFVLDVPGSGLDESRFDKPGLLVVHQGHRLFVDFCVCAVLGAFGRAFPAEFLGIALDRYWLRAPRAP